MSKIKVGGSYKRITKPIIPISVRFSRRKGYDTIQVRISVSGVEGSLFSTLSDGTILTTKGVRWSQKEQRALYTSKNETGSTLNAALDSVRQAIKGVYNRQMAIGIIPTPARIKQEYQTGKPIEPTEAETEKDWSALNCYRAYFKELSSGGFPEKTTSDSTLEKWQYGLDYLETFIGNTKGMTR